MLATATQPVTVDWIGDVLVPVAAILVSAVIAIALAARERRAADRSRVVEGVATLMQDFTELRAAAGRNDANGTNAAVRQISAHINALAAIFKKGHLSVLILVGSAVTEAVEKNRSDVLVKVSNFALAALEGWSRNELPTREFHKQVTDEMRKEWSSLKDLKNWRAVAGLDAS